MRTPRQVAGGMAVIVSSTSSTTSSSNYPATIPPEDVTDDCAKALFRARSYCCDVTSSLSAATPQSGVYANLWHTSWVPRFHRLVINRVCGPSARKQLPSISTDGALKAGVTHVAATSSPD